MHSSPRSPSVACKRCDRVHPGEILTPAARGRGVPVTSIPARALHTADLRGVPRLSEPNPLHNGVNIQT